MWKKLKGGRRQILQLEDNKPSVPPNPPTSLIEYSDSDEESKKSISDDSEHSSAANKEKCPLDSQVADFLKEIDALKGKEESNDASKSSDLHKGESKQEDIEDNLKPGPSGEVNPSKISKESNSNVEDKINCPWREINDSSSGYSYYWNVESNETTWDCPEGYSAYVSQLKSLNKDACSPKEIENQLEKKNEQKEGSIIPISYYGDSSSSESSSSENLSNKAQKKRKKNEKVVSLKKNKSKMSKEIKSETESFYSKEVFGPQLPPDFEFPEDVPVTAELTSVIVSNNNFENVEEPDKCEKGAIVSISTHGDLNKVSEAANLALSSQLNIDASVESTSYQTLEIETLSNNKTTISVGGRMQEAIDYTVNKNDTYKTPVVAKRLVVEYDSFTDEDDEGSSVNTKINEPLFSTVKKGLEKKEIEDTKSEHSNDLRVSNSKTDGKRKQMTKTDEESTEIIKDRVAKKLKTSEFVDIDDMFATQSSNQKHGFGFKKEGDDKESHGQFSKDSCDFKTVPKSKDYKPVSFVKSSHVLDLNELNNSNLEEPDQKVSSPIFDLCVVESKNDCNTDNMSQDITYDSNNTVSTTTENSKDQNSDIKDKEQLVDTHNDDMYDFDEDIDAIDKALCFALERKKALEKKQVLITHAMNDENKSSTTMAVKDEESSTTMAIKDEKESSTTMAEKECSTTMAVKDEKKSSITMFIKDENESSAAMTIIEENKSSTAMPIIEKNKSSTAMPIQEENKSNATIPIKDENKPSATMAKKDENKSSVKKTRKDENKSSVTMAQEYEKLCSALLGRKGKNKSSATKTKKDKNKSSATKTKKDENKSSSTMSIKDKKEYSKKPELLEGNLIKGKCNEADSVEEFDENSILELSSIVLDKLTYLASSHSLEELDCYVVQFKTRLSDWKASALERKYFVDRLQEASRYIQSYEANIAFGDWICKWNSRKKKYYFKNMKTQQSQWSYPPELCSRIATPYQELSLIDYSAIETSILASSAKLFNKDKYKSMRDDPILYSPPPSRPVIDSPPSLPPSSPPTVPPVDSDLILGQNFVLFDSDDDNNQHQTKYEHVGDGLGTKYTVVQR